jgi:hypothetical protein
MFLWFCWEDFPIKMGMGIGPIACLKVAGWVGKSKIYGLIGRKTVISGGLGGRRKGKPPCGGIRAGGLGWKGGA